MTFPKIIEKSHELIAIDRDRPCLWVVNSIHLDLNNQYLKFKLQKRSLLVANYHWSTLVSWMDSNLLTGTAAAAASALTLLLIPFTPPPPLAAIVSLVFLARMLVHSIDELGEWWGIEIVPPLQKQGQTVIFLELLTSSLAFVQSFQPG